MTDLLASLSEHSGLLDGIKRGIEKESLRINTEGFISQSPHPKTLGSALQHPSITTDYSEALLEFITPAFEKPCEPLKYLEQVHYFVYKHIGDEILWVNSMPCITSGELSIPIADYGSSNLGKMKTVYRHGLWHRYGRMMQSISGIHYNFSLPKTFWEAIKEIKGSSQPLNQFISSEYFSLIRNFHRYSWLIIYLFGATPAVCGSFLKNRSHSLENFDGNTLYLPYATSLRMSDLGYQNDEQDSLSVSYNSPAEYLSDLRKAITTPTEKYTAIGIKENGEYKQLNTNLLQIENEYYSFIRPKRTIHSGEKPTDALEERGVEYIELRCIDLDPNLPCGINQEQMAFLDVFIISCLIQESPPITDAEYAEAKENHKRVVLEGRSPNLTLKNQGESVKFSDHAHQMFSHLKDTATFMDTQLGCSFYSEIVNREETKIDNPELTPSAKVLSEMRKNNHSFFPYSLEKAQKQKQYFSQLTPDPSIQTMLEAQVKKSIADQKALEDGDKVSFEEYLKSYFEQ